jgi:FAD/FMN-containing dehydrogenase
MRECVLTTKFDLPTAVATLAPMFSGRLLLFGDNAYEDARKVHNGLIDKRPAVIAQCRGSADIADAVRLAASLGLEIAVRGGGHNVGGRATVDGGMMIDLSLMRSVFVDPAAKIARVEGGATWREFNREAQQFGLATTGGMVGTTGVGGLTLGGGLGWLMPKHGMALDNLLSVDLVGADGTVMRASEQDNRDLFWAVRGGGGNFGVASSLTFRMHQVGPVITGGLCAWPAARARDVLRVFRDLAGTAPDDMMLVAALLTGPDGATKLVAIAAGHFGSQTTAESAVQPIKKFGQPVLDAMGPIPYATLNGLLDGAFPKGALNYWKAHFMDQLSDEAIDTAIDRFAACPSPMSQLLFEHFHGAVTRVPSDGTAYALRSPGFNAVVLGEWLDRAQNDICIGWVRNTYAALKPFGGDRRYLNYLGDDEGSEAGVVAAYGANLARLRQVKAKYDPQNVFHLNVNITPEPEPATTGPSRPAPRRA